jgi:hypothetical protein
VLIENKGALAYYDFHSASTTGTPGALKYFMAVSNGSECSTVGKKVLDYLYVRNGGSFSVDDSYGTWPQGFAYAEKVLGIPSCNPEWTPNLTDGTGSGSVHTTRMVEQYGALVHAHAVMKTQVVGNNVRIPTPKTPTGTADASLSAGAISWDDNYVYVKTSTGWKRAALTAW